jgi:putative membrane protein
MVRQSGAGDSSTTIRLPRAGDGSAWALALAATLAAGPRAAWAHTASGLDANTLWSAWSTQPWLWLLWGLPGLLVLVGIARLWRQAGAGSGMRRWQAVAFLGGWLTIGFSILSPLDALGDELFWVHMVQHELVMLVAAPLLVISRPLGALVWGLPAGWRHGSARLANRIGLQAGVRMLTQPFTAWWLHAIVLWAWHAPALFQAALRQPWIHDIQHIGFFVSALAFWWALLASHEGRRHKGMAVLYLFTTLLHTTLLGALLTFSPRPWYPVYEERAVHWGLSALEDQQLGGLIMWVPGGTVFLAAALVLCVAWMRDSPAPVEVTQAGRPGSRKPSQSPAASR